MRDNLASCREKHIFLKEFPTRLLSLSHLLGFCKPLSHLLAFRKQADNNQDLQL